MELADITKEREFYRYYPPRSTSNGALHSQSLPHPNVQQPETSTIPTNSPPRPTKDKALLAFAQLGALRLNARRCLISFFDRKDCYLVAEATKTTSLCSDEAEFEEDSLCWGSTTFPKRTSICFHTFNLVSTADDCPVGISDNIPYLIVNDLKADPRFRNYASVVRPPYSRFYAGVPIRSPSGHNIGTYCVLDDKPREGLSFHQLQFLKSMAGTVMHHLELIRATEDYRRGGLMVKSLGSFAEGRSEQEEAFTHDPWSPDKTVTNLSSTVTNMSPLSAETISTSRSGPHENVQDMSPGLNQSNVTSPSTTESAEPTFTPGSYSSVQLTQKTSSSSPRRRDGISPEIRATFGRASHMLVDAIEADGVAFFDAKVSTFGGLVDDDIGTELPEPDKPCILLGGALSKVYRASLMPAVADCTMSESVLRHLLRSYPHGEVFHLDADLDSAPLSSPVVDGATEMLDGFPLTVMRKSESVRSMQDENYLRSVFPTAKRLILYPLWDPHRDRWFACAAVWTTNPLRVFTNEQELSYLTAFSNTVMAEVARLDTKLADAAKADFISSISHELRSPLHGILGMTDLLKDSQMDQQQASHVATIETCGKTLLETINHVLDFAKINNLSRDSTKRQSKRISDSKPMISPRQAHTNDIMTLIDDVDMSVLTEDVVESVFAGYTYAQTSAHTFEIRNQDKITPMVSLILDINFADNYIFRTQPGAWRRVIMNLFGNSLKYTPAGYIKVKLEMKSKLGTSDECVFRLTVTDSGIGMSEDYINNRLFHSFAQENSLSQGTGLGLSIVKQIVDSLGGDVEVRSEKGRGTKLTVTCPLKKSIVSPTFYATGTDANKGQQLLAVGRRTRGLKVRFLGFDGENDHFVEDLKNKTASKLTLKALNYLFSDWFGMINALDGQEADLIVASECVARQLRLQHGQSPEQSSTTPVIVICEGPASTKSVTAVTVPGMIFECITQPVGPHKMARALSSCLDRHLSRQVTTQLNITEPRSIDNLCQLENIPPLTPTPAPQPAEIDRPSLTSTSSAPELRSVSHPPLRKSINPKPARPLNCLAVDDNPINLRLLRTFIDKLGHNHVLAINGLEAVNAYKAAQPNIATSSTDPTTPPLPIRPIDVVLMDIQMPIMDGLEATRQIRALENRSNSPKVTIIALTGVADTKVQQEANSSGVNLFMIKPVRLADLDVVLRGVVGGKEKEREETEREDIGVGMGLEGKAVVTDVVDGLGAAKGVEHATGLVASGIAVTNGSATVLGNGVNGHS